MTYHVCRSHKEKSDRAREAKQQYLAAVQPIIRELARLDMFGSPYVVVKSGEMVECGRTYPADIEEYREKLFSMALYLRDQILGEYLPDAD